MPNIKFAYLYRDAGNYKNYNEIIFDNPTYVSVEIFRTLIESKFIDKQWFYAKDLQLPELYFEEWDRELDHDLHEFESLTFTNKVSNSPFSIDYFFELMKEAQWIC